MSGRQETDQAYKNRIAEIIKVCPDYFEDFYYYMSNLGEGFKYNAIKQVHRFLKYLEQEKHIDINKCYNLNAVSCTDVRKYLDTEMSDTSIDTRGRNLVAIKKFFAFAEDDGLIEKNNLKKLRIPSEKKEISPVAMDEDEVEKMFQNIMTSDSDTISKARDLAIISLMLELGLRRGSVSEMDLQDVDLEHQTIYLTTKGNYRKQYSIGKKVTERLSSYLDKRHQFVVEDKPTDAFFLNYRGGRLSGKSINEIVKKYAWNVTDKHITAHKLRSTCATLLYEKTEDIYLTSHLLGHKDVSTTERYTRVSEKKLRNAAHLMEDLI